jgi:catalase
VDASEIVRAAYTLRRDDDDFGQPGTLYRKVLDEPARARLAYNITQHTAGCTPEVLARVVDYWTKVDPDLGSRVAAGVGLAVPSKQRSVA